MIRDSNFDPPWYLRNPHVQTILANALHPTPPQVSLETVTLPDGDRLQLARGTASGKHTVLILHGLEGSLKSAYAQRMMNALNQADIPAAFMYFRSCNGKPNRMLRSYHSGETGDLKKVVKHLKQTGSKHIALVGYSLGGNVVLKYMGENEPDPVVACAATVSVPLLLDVCAERMDRGFSKLYQHTLLKRLKKKIIQKSSLFDTAGYDTDLADIKNFIQFDNRFTAPVHGFSNAIEYYRISSSRQYLRTINKPTLIIHAKDDPFMSSSVIPESKELSESVTMEISRFGGHIGFLQGHSMNLDGWLEKRIMAFIADRLY
jgi:predicted alpha/beta-fold hydrolase